VTMQNAQRSEEEPRNPTRAVTMQNAQRSEEEPRNPTAPGS
jgi:diglucosylglycerate octanoyltransferase